MGLHSRKPGPPRVPGRKGPERLNLLASSSVMPGRCFLLSVVLLAASGLLTLCFSPESRNPVGDRHLLGTFNVISMGTTRNHGSVCCVASFTRE